MKRHRLFNDIASVSRGDRIALKEMGLLNPDDTVIGWRRLSPWLRDRTLLPIDAKRLILLELEGKQRGDTITRLVNYLGNYERETNMEKVNNYLEKGDTDAR